jgi:hypothetical protein
LFFLIYLLPGKKLGQSLFLLLKCPETLLFKKYYMRSATIFSIFILQIYLPLTAQNNKNDTAQYRFSLQSSASEMYESFVMTDPSLKLSRSPIVRMNIGFAFAYHYNDKTRFILDYQREGLGNSALFINPTFYQAIINPRIFSKFGLFYDRDVLPVYEKKRLRLFIKAGAAFSFASAPFSGGTSFFGSIAPNGDTLEFVSETIDVKRASFVSLGGGIGLRYAVSKRLFVNASINRMWNITSNDVTTNDIRYKAFDLSNVSFANSRTTGDVLSYRLAIGYNFYRNEKSAVRKARAAKASKEADSVRRFAISFNTSNNYPTIHLNDTAGYLKKANYLRFTFGLQLRYRISNRWYISGGFESFPNSVDPRPDGVFAGSGTSVNNALQFPLSAEYKLLSVRKKIKFDLFVKSGLVLGVQFFTNPRVSIANPDSSYFVFENPVYYEEIEASTLRKKAFLSAAASLNLNLYLSRSVFLLGYINQQVALNPSPFIQRDVQYKMNANQVGYYSATAYSTGSVFQVGFGFGFRF